MSKQQHGRLTIFQAAAVDDSRLGNAAFRVLAALGTYSDKDGWCYPTQATLASRLSITRQAVNKSLQQLSDLGYITIKPQFNQDGGKRANLYRLNLDRPAETMQPDVAPMQPEVDTHATPEVASHATYHVASHATSEVAYNVPLERPIETTHSKEQVKRAKRPPTPAPDDFPISVEMEEWADANCPEVDLPKETRRFLDSARSKGREYADWLAAWRGWMTNDFPKAMKRGRSARASPNGEPESKAQARERRTLEAIWGKQHGQADIQPEPIEARYSVVGRADPGAD